MEYDRARARSLRSALSLALSLARSLALVERVRRPLCSACLQGTRLRLILLLPLSFSFGSLVAYTLPKGQAWRWLTTADAFQKTSLIGRPPI